jgi:hypothetical protein
VRQRRLRRLDPLPDALLGSAEKLAGIAEGQPDLSRERAGCFDVQRAQLGLEGLLLRASRPLSTDESVHVVGQLNVPSPAGLRRGAR